MIWEFDLLKIRGQAFCTIDLLQCHRLLMSIGSLDRRYYSLEPSRTTDKLLVSPEPVPGPLDTALLFAVHLLDHRQPLLPLGIRELEGTALPRVADDDLRVVIPVDTQQALQVPVVATGLPRKVEESLYAVVLNMFPPGDDGQDVK